MCACPVLKALAEYGKTGVGGSPPSLFFSPFDHESFYSCSYCSLNPGNQKEEVYKSRRNSSEQESTPGNQRRTHTWMSQQKKGKKHYELGEKKTKLPKDSVLCGRMVVVLRHTKRQKSEKKILHHQSPRKIPFCILSS